MKHFKDSLNGWFSFPVLYKTMVDQATDHSHFVEVGAFLGKSASYMAVEIINSKKNIKFDCVDLWKVDDDMVRELGWENYIGTGPIQPDYFYNLYLQNIQPVKHVINNIRSSSVEASKLYEDNSLDFVFIDAAHDYKSVYDDLVAWFPKVKPNGIIAGHDYFDPSVPENVNKFDGLRNAVDTFFNYSPKLQTNKTEFCWLYIK